MKFKLPVYQRSSLKNLIFGIFICLIFQACTASTDSDLNLGEARIKIYNASPDNSMITFYVNDTLKTPQALSFSQSTNYANTAAGSHIVYTKTGANEIRNSKFSFLFQQNKSYSIFIGGKISKDSLVYISTEDNLTAPSANKAKVRLINASPNSPSVDAVFSTNLTDSIPNFMNTNFRSGTIYTEFDPGNYIIRIRTAGTKTVITSDSNLNIVAGKIYTICIKGLLNGSGNFALSTVLISDN
ncbi:DUF4397 domain-containing protein [Pedobacter cryophilus]|uniref:DUF4397 domain-containing protein n=1 Tax=Pedobacter cryophilus TaxID=2571271 RepID=A0A4U1BTR1_9SPHI|nr:DUF4397 domain-containing protein [Pedobacter cryophilus]TKB95989.1 DUF4397 domain-containing protein [Pedobacter cryophilus]